jgi:aminopeptidase
MSKIDRNEKLAATLVSYSCKLRKGERVLISYEGSETKPLVKEIVRQVYKIGGEPFVEIRDSEIKREILLGGSEAQFKLENKHTLAQMKEMDCYIAIRGGNNSAELADVPAGKMNSYTKALSGALRYRVGKTKWVVLRYPNYSMAQAAGTSLEAFEDFYYKVCNLDYSKMSRAMDALVRLMEKTDKVRILGPETDLNLSIKGIPAIKCAGERNIPDGEIFTAPIKNSMNGKISYTASSEEQGFTYENICFEVKDGKIVKATANDNRRINKLLDTDAGARFFGEFSFGVNPHILRPMKDTLFDEKIAGSFHLTPGAAYDEADNGNKSALHWDLVNIQRKEYGGGEIYFDGKLIRKDGLFTLKQLEGLNPKNLK